MTRGDIGEIFSFELALYFTADVAAHVARRKFWGQHKPLPKTLRCSAINNNMLGMALHPGKFASSYRHVDLKTLARVPNDRVWAVTCTKVVSSSPKRGSNEERSKFSKWCRMST